MTIDGMVDLIILKKPGMLIIIGFLPSADKTHLMDEPLPVISSIAAEMFADVDGIEVAEKLKSDPLRYNVMALADRLHKTQAEIEELTPSEINEWFAYFKVVEDGQIKILKIQITAIDRTKAAFRGIAVSLGKVQKALFSFKTAIVGWSVPLAWACARQILAGQHRRAWQNSQQARRHQPRITEAFRFAAELAGVSTRTTDMAIQRFTAPPVLEAAVDTGEAKNALIELGLNAEELAKLPLEKQMLELSAAFDKVEDSGDRVRLAFKLFDSEGVAFINTLEGGRDALQATLAGLMISASLCVCDRQGRREGE